MSEHWFHADVYTHAHAHALYTASMRMSMRMSTRVPMPRAQKQKKTLRYDLFEDEFCMALGNLFLASYI